MSEHKGRPGGLQPIINGFAGVAETVITERMQNFAFPINGFGKTYLESKRHNAMLHELIRVYRTCLEWCQLGARGLIGVPHGSRPRTGETIYLPITKNKRCDTEPGDKDYMLGLAELAGVCTSTFYDILGFLRTLGLIEHGGHENHPNKDKHSIRISLYCIPDYVREALFKVCAVSDLCRARYEKKNTKAIARATTEPTPPRLRLFRAGVPPHISEAISAKAQEINEALKSTAERTAAETYDLLRAFGRAIMPQGP